MNPAAAIAVSSLGKVFPNGTRALEDVSFEIPAGQVVALVGKSGSGKSTLLRCLNGLVGASTGQISVLGHPVADLNGRGLRELRSKIGFVMQQFALVGRLSAIENVLAGSLATLSGPRLGIRMFPQEVRESALAQLDRVGLRDQAFQRADTLSGGQMQRVAIARSLLQEPLVLLADEPVSSLDPESSKSVLALLRELADERRLTVVAAMHQFEQAKQFSDRLLGLASGRIVLDKASGGITKKDADALYLSEGQ